MKTLFKTTIVGLIGLISAVSVLAQDIAKEGAHKGNTGVLILAHGGKQNWDEEVNKVAAEVNRKMPAEVAFGMASKRTIQKAIDKLVERGAERIVAVPLFISSHSSVITATEYLLGLRDTAPPELAAFAKMDHSGGGDHAHHSMDDMSFDPTTPVKSPVPIKMVSALNRDPVVADILLARASSVSERPEEEVVVVVAHGPVSDEDNARWLADIGALAGIMRARSDFKRIEYLTVRDDAPEPIYSQAREELRAVVGRAAADGDKVLVVPLLLAFGGIEEGIKKRLEGLSYTMTDQALLPDERLAGWVLTSAESTVKN